MSVRISEKKQEEEKQEKSMKGGEGGGLVPGLELAEVDKLIGTRSVPRHSTIPPPSTVM